MKFTYKKNVYIVYINVIVRGGGRACWGGGYVDRVEAERSHNYRIVF